MYVKERKEHTMFFKGCNIKFFFMWKCALLLMATLIYIAHFRLNKSEFTFCLLFLRILYNDNIFTVPVILHFVVFNTVPRLHA